MTFSHKYMLPDSHKKWAKFINCSLYSPKPIFEFTEFFFDFFELMI